MSFHVLKVESMRNELKNLQDIIHLQDRIRAKKEVENRSKTAQSEKYKTLFEPVTSSLSSLGRLHGLAPGVVAAPGNRLDLANHPEHAPDMRPGPAFLPVADLQDIKFGDAPANTLYEEAIQSVPPGLWDDGYFGLGVRTNRIGRYRYHLDGDTLQIYNDDVEVGDGDEPFVTYDIHDLDYWMFLVSIRPSAINMNVVSKFKPQAFLPEYRRMAAELELVKYAEESGLKGYKIRTKYRLLGLQKGRLRGSREHQQMSGDGFLFSYKGPNDPNNSKLVHPSTVVIPSDNAGLRRALLTALVELRGGNTSMQNIVVPLAHAAKRKKILPPNLLTPGETNWIFA